jgi:hypothetical protein
MSSSNLIRWRGLALLISSVLFALFFVLHPGGGDPATVEAALNQLYASEHTLGVAGMILMLFGVEGLYTGQSPKIGRLGLIGVILAYLGTALLLGVLFFDAYFIPLIAAHAPNMLDATGPLNTPPGVLALALPSLPFGLGFILLGIATIRADKLPRWGGLLLIIGAIVVNLPPQPVGPFPAFVLTTGAIVLSIGLGWLGYALWSNKSATTAQS